MDPILLRKRRDQMKVILMKSLRNTTRHQRKMLMFQRTVKKTILIYQNTLKSRQIMRKKMARGTARKRVARTGVN